MMRHIIFVVLLWVFSLSVAIAANFSVTFTYPSEGTTKPFAHAELCLVPLDHSYLPVIKTDEKGAALFEASPTNSSDALVVQTNTGCMPIPNTYPQKYMFCLFDWTVIRENMSNSIDMQDCNMVEDCQMTC